jgi:hypothetical protein
MTAARGAALAAEQRKQRAEGVQRKKIRGKNGQGLMCKTEKI